MKTEEAIEVAKRSLRAQNEIHLLAEALDEAGCLRAAGRVRCVATTLIDSIELDFLSDEESEA